MPVIDGKPVRARYTALKLGELSSVDRPAQPGALAAILKRDDSPPAPAPASSIMALAVAKYVCDEDGAHTFQEVLQENEFSEKIWPMTSALSQAIRSIMGDRTIKAPERETKVTQSVQEFLAAVRSISPETMAETEKRLARLISKRSEDMPTIEELQAELAKAKAAMTVAETTAEEEKAKAKKALEDLAAEQTAHAATRKALIEATDEVVTVGGQEIRKSIAGESFPVVKAMADERDMAQFEKRAEIEFGSLPGTAVEKAAVLKALSAMPEATRKSLESIMASAEKMASGAFSRIGHGGDVPASVQKAQGDYNAKVTEIQKRDGCSKAEAMTRARTEAPELFDAMQAAA